MMVWFSILGILGVISLADAQQSCTLCPNGSMSPTPLLRIPTISGVYSCSELEAQADAIQDDAECHHFRELSGYATLCRCYQSDETCTFCADGTTPDSVTDEDLCEEEFLYIPYLKKGTDACTRIQHTGFLECGCPVSPIIDEDSCTLCADGEDPTADLTTLVDDTTTCSQMLAIASSTPKDSSKCHAIQTRSQEPCGCSNQVEMCGLCADGSTPPFPDRIIDVQNTTCADVHNAVDTTSPICKSIQSAGHFLCGCPTLPEIEDPQGPCTLCAGGEAFESAAKYSAEDTLELTTCAETAAAVYSSGGSSPQCQYHQAYAFLYCGCVSMPSIPEDPACTLCPGGKNPMNPDNIVPESDGLTCAAANSVVAHLFGSETCEGLEELQEACDCPDPEPCSLCGGMADTLLESANVIATSNGDFSCGEIDQVARNFEFGTDLTAFQDRCERFQDRYSGGCCTVIDMDVGGGFQTTTSAVGHGSLRTGLAASLLTVLGMAMQLLLFF